jgi:hypothetical protein
MPFRHLLLLAALSSSCAVVGRPRTLFSLGIVFTNECGAVCEAAEDAVKANEIEVVASIQKARTLQKMGINRINWSGDKRSKLLCNKKERRCMYSLRPGDVQKAASVSEFLEDLPVAYTSDVITSR